MQQRLKGWRLETSGYWMFGVAVVVLSAIRLGLWLLPFRTVLKGIRKISQPASSDPPKIGKLVWAVNQATRIQPSPPKCLARALTAQVLMQWYGHTPELKVGVAKTADGQLEAHAWIEYQGRVVLGNLPQLSRFIPLPSLEQVNL